MYVSLHERNVLPSHCFCSVREFASVKFSSVKWQWFHDWIIFVTLKMSLLHIYIWNSIAFLRIHVFWDVGVISFGEWFLTFWRIMMPSTLRITHWHTVISQKTWILNNSFVRTSNLTVLYLMMISLTLLAYSF